MPIYEYRCQECKTLFETLVTGAAGTEEVVCKQCGGKNVKKTISAAGFRIAGGGSNSPAGALSGCATKSGFS